MQISFGSIVRLQTLSPQKENDESSKLKKRAIIDTLNNNRKADNTYTREEQEMIRGAFKNVVQDYIIPERNKPIRGTEKGIIPFTVGKNTYFCTGNDCRNVSAMRKRMRQTHASPSEEKNKLNFTVKQAKNRKNYGVLCVGDIKGNERYDFFEINHYLPKQKDANTSYLREIVLI